MSIRKFIILLSILVYPGFSQSTYHAYGLGVHTPSFDGVTLATSGTGLVPAYRFGLSLNNPATWNRFVFSTLSGAYSGLRVDQMASSVRNEFSGVDKIQFIVPIKGLYGFGMGIKPYSQQKYSFTYDQNDLIIDQDTLQLSKEYSGRGGISSFYSGISFPLSDKEQAGIKFDFLYGSSRRSNNLFVDAERFQSNTKHYYSGTVLTGYLSSTRFRLINRQLHIYVSAGAALYPLTVYQSSMAAYQDMNANGYYDMFDFPDSVAEESSTTLNAYKPQEFGLGIDYSITQTIHLLAEIFMWKNTSDVAAGFSVLNDDINQWTHTSLSLVSFAASKPKEWYEKIPFRSGVYMRKNDFLLNQDSAIEVGASFGFGINFGFPVNQIDVAFMAGERRTGSTKTESIRRIAFSLNLTDIWFVKRRNRN